MILRNQVGGRRVTSESQHQHCDVEQSWSLSRCPGLTPDLTASDKCIISRLISSSFPFPVHADGGERERGLKLRGQMAGSEPRCFHTHLTVFLPSLLDCSSLIASHPERPHQSLSSPLSSQRQALRLTAPSYRCDCVPGVQALPGQSDGLPGAPPAGPGHDEGRRAQLPLAQAPGLNILSPVSRVEMTNLESFLEEQPRLRRTVIKTRTKKN